MTFQKEGRGHYWVAWVWRDLGGASLPPMRQPTVAKRRGTVAGQGLGEGSVAWGTSPMALGAPGGQSARTPALGEEGLCGQ